MQGAKKIEWKSVDKLIPYAKNARTHSDEQIAEIAGSIKAFGFNNPVLVDKENSIIAGHGRVLAARKLGMDKVPVVEIEHLTEAERKAYVLADNRIALNAGWDIGMLSLELQDLQDKIDLSLLGFDPDELDALLNPIEETEGLTDEDFVPEVPDEPKTKLGDIYILGNHRLMCGDSTSIDAVEKLMNGHKADICFTSPPYGAGNVAKLRDHYVAGAETRKSFYSQHKDNPNEWGDLMDGWFNAIRPNVEVVICNVQMLADNKKKLMLWVANKVDDLIDIVIWDKENAAPQMQKNVLGNVWEFIFLFGGNGSRAIPFAKFHGNQNNIVRVNPKGKNEFAGVHRAVMPTDLANWVLKDLFVNAKSIIEPFGGTGTTMIVAEKLGKQSYLMELDPKYCDVIVKRWEEFTGKTAQLVELSELVKA